MFKYIILLTLTAIVFFSCSKIERGTDVVKITGESEFLTAEDLRKGVKGTSNSISAVYLSHEVHEKGGVPCAGCHHKERNPSRIKKCAYCHKGARGVKHLHAFCIGCHRKKKSGPVPCEGCHIEDNELSMAEFVSLQFSARDLYDKKYHPLHENKGIKCVTCHHSDGDNPDRRNIKKCSRCHRGTSKMKILHKFCKECHGRDKKGPMDCRGCHRAMKKIDVADSIVLPKTGHRKPSITFNHKAHVEKYNTECVDCHHKMKNVKCSLCHKKKDQKNIINLKGAYHQQCHDCHRRTKGPRACGRCHVDKRKR